MNQKKNYEKLTNSEKKQIKDFMEWGTGKNDINSWGIPEQMTMHEKNRYAILFTLGILFLSILDCKNHNLYVNSETEKNKHKKANSISLFISSGAGAITIVSFNRLMGFIFGDEILQIVMTAMFMLGIGLIAFANSVYSLKIYYRHKFGLRTSFDIEF